MRFSKFINSAANNNQLVVQPRMGFSSISEMQNGLKAVKASNATSVGTITLDSFTRVGDHESARQAVRQSKRLNGFPIVMYGPKTTRKMVADIQTDEFPIQVRHGSALPQDIFKAIKEAGMDATEGGPVSYCLPYSRVPLKTAIQAWSECCEKIAAPRNDPSSIHLETFGGCLLGQMCPPSLLLAVSILEGIFFREHGVFDMSLSYAQQTSFEQDIAALGALRILAAKYLSDVDWHVVLYTYMGVYPRTQGGAMELLGKSVMLARFGGAERLIVKTKVEAERIPDVEDNIEALEFAARQSGLISDKSMMRITDETTQQIHDEADALVQSVLNLHVDTGKALLKAFKKGYLDIPYCLHRDNENKARSFIDPGRFLCWHSVGKMPIKTHKTNKLKNLLNPYEFLNMLSTVERSFDQKYLPSSLV